MSEQWDDGVITARRVVCVITVNCVVIKCSGVLLKMRDVKVHCRLITVKPAHNTASSLTREAVRCRLARLIGSVRWFWQMEGLKKRGGGGVYMLHQQPEHVKGQSHYPQTPAAHQASTNQHVVFSAECHSPAEKHTNRWKWRFELMSSSNQGHETVGLFFRPR